MEAAKNNKKTIWAWAMFDWANQSYNMVITSTIFPSYFVYITTFKNKRGDIVSFFGHDYVNTVLSTYILGLSYLIIAFLLPILTSIADYKGHKKLYMQLFTWLGSLACAGLFFFTMDTFEFGMICFGLASIGYCGGFVFYNSYLPQIATIDQQDAVSAKGFIYGFAGSIVVQVLCFVFVLFPETFGMTGDFAARFSFLIVAVWWIGFSLIPFYLLPKGVPNAGSHQYNVLTGGFKELAKVWKKVKELPLLKRFLPAFFFYSVGVQTILLVAANFGAKELKMPEENLIAIILIIQVVAIIGAAITAKMSTKYGNTKVLAAIVGTWCVICGGLYFIGNANQFYAAAVLVGLVMGGVQSLSRSTYSKYIPQNIPDTASYFSFYDVTEKLSIVVGLFTFGFVEALTHEMRDSALVLDCFFAIGLILLLSLIVVEARVRSAESVAV
ncbi:MAG TPA: MFS transporter [Mucilaginibacter sp.]|nr:MFS transporter [Mucilaginibacter sp.]